MWSLPQVVQLYHRRRGSHCRGHPESQSPTVGTGMLLWVNYGQHELSRMERVSSCLVGMMLTPHLDSRNIPRLSTMVTVWSQDAAALLTTLEEKPKSLSCVPLQSCPDVPDPGWRFPSMDPRHRGGTNRENPMKMVYQKNVPAFYDG